MEKLNKKPLRTYAEKVKIPELVRSIFTEVACEIKTIAVFDVHRLGESVLITALFNKQGCFAVIYTRKSGEAISYELESNKFFKQRHIDESFYGNDMAYINTESVSSFFKITAGEEKPLTTWMRKISSYRWKQRIIRQKEKSKKSCARFKALSPIPSNFKSWCRRDLSRIVFDTSDRKHGHCQYCNCDIEMDQDLIQGHSYKCPHCHHTFEAISYNGHAWRRQKGYSLLSEMNGALVIRHFIFRIYKKWEPDFFEYERDILSGDGYSNYIRTRIGSFEYWRNYKKPPNWYGTGDPEIYWADEQLYPFSGLSLLKKQKRKIVAAEAHNEYRWESALTFEAKNLELAQILNAAGYSNSLSYGVYEHYTEPSNNPFYPYNSEKEPIVTYGRNPKEILRLDGNFAKLFREKQYGYNELVRYDSFRSTKESRSPKAFEKSLTFAIRSRYEDIYEKYIKLLRKFEITAAQTYKYFSGRCDIFTFNHWYDYLQNYYNAAQLADIQLTGKSWIFPPIKDIKKKHDEAYHWYQSEYKLKKEKERELKNQQLALFVSGLSSLDNYTIDGMIAVLPHTYGDFVIEGTNQSNCVGGHGYFDAMASSESIIVFLRTKKDESYCTCEFSLRGDKIRLVQCRLKKNKEAPDKVQRIAKKYGKLLEKQILLNHAAA